mmetsp:Transcript_93169/g.269095  ORF Transcript_93169/g.269095 Transcript_93169/m.269095 type:complete len:1327 (+) Transcript_93169:359-4339(+)
MVETTSTATDKPVPSITLSIAQDDVKRVLEASEAVAKTLARLQESETEAASSEMKVEETPGANDNESVKTESGKSKRPLHEMVYEAARQSENPMLQEFLDKMKASGSTALEVRAGILVFHDLPMSQKMELIFDVLGTEHASKGDDAKTEQVLSREGAKSLFRSVIVAISSCIHQDKRVQIEMSKETVTAEPPTKRRKISTQSSPDSDKSVKTTGGDSVPTLQSPSRSFDSSMGTLRDEDEIQPQGVRKEFEDIAVYASDRLMRYCTKKGFISKSDAAAVTFANFEDWRKSESPKIAPWLALLDLARWKPPPRSTSRATTQSAAPPIKKEAEVKESLKPTVSSDQEEPRPAAAEKAKETLMETSNEESIPKESPKRKEVTNKTSDATSPVFEEAVQSRTVVSFDFTGSVPEADQASVFCINISESNLATLHNLVRGTGLASRPVSEITGILLGAAKTKEERQIVPIERFHTCLHQLMGSGSQSRLSKFDKEVFTSAFADFFGCFDTRQVPLEAGEADANELAIGFCILGAGNKSTKLAAGFELLESSPSAGLTTEQLTTFLRSYLTMLCGISLLTSSSDGVMKPKLNSLRRRAIYQSVENGSKWTMSHFLKTTKSSREDVHSFETFANWYTAGGYNVAPWLELLDLKKLLSLTEDAANMGPNTPPTQEPINHFPGPSVQTPKYLSPQTPHFGATPSNFSATPSDDPFTPGTSTPGAQVLFTFPLANQRSLVVLKEDASYVRKVVDQLGLLSMSPDEVWSSLHATAQKYPQVQPHRGAKPTKGAGTGKAMIVDRSTFVSCLQEVIQNNNSHRKRTLTGTRDVLINFFHSFDLLQVDRVALNELMGGLTLLCGGKKSTKLAFAFGVFDQRPLPKSKKNKKTQLANSLGGEELFLFLRSFLIVMFSCCRQSWDLTDDDVNRYIADTANMVTDDVMRYQWRTRKKDRVDFDEFGRWYNEGGFETAPWLELLDLKKWVLVESLDRFDLRSSSASPGMSSGGALGDCPPAPPDESMDPSFFDDDAAVALMPMDSIDEMDLLLMQPSQDKENDAELNKLSRSFSFSPGSNQKSRPLPQPKNSNSLKFQLVTEDDNRGYVVSVSQKRIQHLRQLLVDTNLCTLDAEDACKKIIGKSSRDEKTGAYVMSKDDFDSAMRGIVSSKNLSIESQRALSAILSEIFTAFDHEGTGHVNATEVACGFTVFCKGKKSDKLEYAFEVLDRTRRGKLSQSDTAKYLRSFLTVLLNVVSTSALDSDEDDTMSTTSGTRCDRTISTVARAVEAGSSWAASQAFRSRRGSRETICFDEFAEWYTHVGYSNIPWLELLDLHKWVIMES